MSQLNNTLKILNLKDKNIIFYNNYLKELKIKGKRSLVFEGYLSYTPKYCMHCGCIFDENIVKHGYKLSKLTIPKVSNLNSYLYLYKQRYKCRHCNHTFSCNTSEVELGCYISNSTKHAIALDATKKISEKDIAVNNNVSHSTVNRIIDSYKSHIKLFKNYLPENMCFDEFKSVKSAVGLMSFNFCNADTGEIIDIVEDRRLYSLTKYFSRYSRDARLNVKNIIIDMYTPYIVLIKAMFPNANIITDKFHTVQLINRALNKTRINLMNKDKLHYNKLKRYWKLLLRDRDSLNHFKFQKYTCLEHFMTEVDIVDYLLDLDIYLKESYWFYQHVRQSIKLKNIDKFDSIIDAQHYNLSSYMLTAQKTLIEHRKYIHNAINSNLSNGKIEGINNLIKVIKRISFGYRSFLHFKARILLISGLINPTYKSI
ncbi:MAG: ISL3 family transposase [Bacilli bacterium]|nr:ISL3 family transposase [Bacilli bacterium]MDD3305337.1 ISL3 family transposase [Bacilli bacterium]MDD4053629.1 ISL3 family transposase [Bacilli bacterium]MDD4411128.1 ISL3 family transposase [Bacilli bacterium]